MEIIGKIFAETWYCRTSVVQIMCVCPAKKAKDAHRKRNDNTKSKAGCHALSYHANSKPLVSISIARRICVITECWKTFGIDSNLGIMAMGA